MFLVLLFVSSLMEYNQPNQRKRKDRKTEEKNQFHYNFVPKGNWKRNTLWIAILLPGCQKLNEKKWKILTNNFQALKVKRLSKYFLFFQFLP